MRILIEWTTEKPSTLVEVILATVLHVLSIYGKAAVFEVTRRGE